MSDSARDSLIPARWDEGPCYLCGDHVPSEVGWHREDEHGHRRHWCPAHRPAWSWGEKECIQHGYDWSAICPICGKWWTEQAAPEDRRRLTLIAGTLTAGAEDA